MPVGGALPSDATCAGRVVAAGEVRSGNATANQTRGRAGRLSGPLLDRVTGDFVGTTDEILQWGACKWGLPTDWVRAQAATESWWRAGNLGDFSTDASRCAPGHPLGSDGQAGQCPHSIGIMQVKWFFHQGAYPDAATSTAYNLDYALAQWRLCFEGHLTWLNDVERGQDYTAGDAWGCMGRWFSGRWYTSSAVQYIADVQANLANRVWTDQYFPG